MQLIKVEREWSSEQKHFPFVFLGDAHLGNPNCDKAKLKAHIQEIKDSNALVWLMGDLAEYIDYNDKRFSHSQIDEDYWHDIDRLPMAYLDTLESLLLPIAEQIVVIHDGNHERKMMPRMEPGWELCKRLQTYGGNPVYVPGEAYTKVSFRAATGGNARHVMVNTAHGHQAGRKSGAKHNSMGEMFAWIGADVIVRGHSHELFADLGSLRETPTQRMERLELRPTVYAMSGSYLNGRAVSPRPSYAERAGYRPLPTGHARVNVRLAYESKNVSTLKLEMEVRT